MPLDDLVKLDGRELMAMFYGCKNEAFEEIVEKHKSKIFNFILRVCRYHLETAEDAYQETFLSLWLHKDVRRFDTAEPLSPFLFGIARKKAFGANRDRRPQRIPGNQSGLAQKPDQVSAVQSTRVYQAIMECCSRLTKQEKDFFFSWKETLGDKSQTQIAKDIGVSIAYVNKIKKKCLAKLVSCLTEKGY